MKRIVSIAALFAIAVGFVSCNKEEINSVPEEGYTYSFAILDDATRATMDNLGVAWEANDQVGMYLDGYTGYAKVDLSTTPKSVTLYSRNEIPANSYAYAYYPYNSANNDKTATKVVISNIQDGGSNAAMPMAGIPFKIETAISVEGNSAQGNGAIRFLNLGSIIDFKIFSTNYTGETVQYVTFKADNGTVSGDGIINLTAIDANDASTLELAFTGNNNYDNVKVNQEVAVADSKDAAESIYMVVAPGTYSGTITIGTDVATYTFNFSNKQLNRNGLKHYNMNLDNATRVAEVVEVVKDLPYFETFANGKGEFVIEDISNNDSFTIWTHSTQNGSYMKATGYENSSTRHAAESMLISPWIDLTSASHPCASFDHAHRYAGTVAEELTFWVMTQDTGSDWQQVTIPTYAPGNNWNLVSSGEIDLTSYAGKIVKVAFKYISDGTSSGTSTWEINNFQVSEKVFTTEFTIASEAISVQVGKAKQNMVSVNSGATISYVSDDEDIATVDANGIVTGVAVGETTITVSVPAYNGYPAAEASFTVSVTPAGVEKSFTWDLSKATYNSAGSESIVWSNDNVTMQNTKGTGTAPNNYIPPTRTSTRFYSGNLLTITPEENVEITKVEFTATSENYASSLASSTWSNAAATIDNNTTVVLSPIDGTLDISATIGGTCGLTAVKVYYTGGTEVVETEYSVTVNSCTNGTVTASPTKAIQGTEITLTVTPEDNYVLETLSVKDANNNDINITDNKFIMPASDVIVSASFIQQQTGGATTYIMTIDSAAGSNGTCNVTWKNAETTSVSYNGITWSTSVEGNPAFQGSNSYCTIGSKSNPATKVLISTTDFAGKKIVSAKLTGYCTSNTGPALTITAGSTVMLPSTQLVKTTSTEYVSTVGNVTLNSGDALAFEINSSAAAGIVISKIEVTYE